MKKTFRLLFAVCMFVAMVLPMASCSDDNSDDKDDNGKVDEIYGTWVMRGGKQTDVFYFDKKGNGYANRSIAREDGDADVGTVPFTYTAEGWNTGRVKVTINYIKQELDPEEPELDLGKPETEVLYLKVSRATMVMDNHDTFVRAEINKNFVGKWERDGVDVEEEEDGTISTLSYTMTFEFKSSGDGEVKISDVVNTVTQQVVEQEKKAKFTWTVAGLDGTMLMVRVDDAENGNAFGKVRQYDVMLSFNEQLNKDVLTLDGDMYLKK